MTVETTVAAPAWLVAANGVAHFVSGTARRSACGQLSVSGHFGARTTWREIADNNSQRPRCGRCGEYDAPDTVGYDDMCAVGLTYRQLDHWVRTGHLRALPRRRGQGGPPRRFPASEVPVAAMMARLTAVGLGLDAAERVARGGELAPGLRVVADGEP